MSERIDGPSLEEWKAAYNSSPGCHHASPTFEVINPKDAPDIAKTLMGKLAVENNKKIEQVIADIDALTRDPESDEQA